MYMLDIRSYNQLSMNETGAYRIRKKFCGGFNFVVFVDDKDPRILFHKKGYDPRNLLHFLLTNRW